MTYLILSTLRWLTPSLPLPHQPSIPRLGLAHSHTTPTLPPPLNTIYPNPLAFPYAWVNNFYMQLFTHLKNNKAAIFLDVSHHFCVKNYTTLQPVKNPAVFEWNIVLINLKLIINHLT